MVWLDDGGRARDYVRLIAPPRKLAPWVEHFWIQTEPVHTFARPWRIVADSCGHLVFSIESRAGREQIRCSVVGARAVYEDIDVARRSLTIGVRLRLGAAAQLTRSRADALTGRSLRIEDVFGSAGRGLTDRMRRRSLLTMPLVSSAWLLRAQPPAPESGAEFLRQFRFESKLWPNLHHFLYVLARWRNNSPDRFRAAVRQAPLDVAGFDGLPGADRQAWDEAIAAYQIHAAPLDISYGKLVDVNYALADLPAAAALDKATGVPAEIRKALEKAEPVYRKLWWPRHNAANQTWIDQLRPQVEQYGPRLANQLAAAFHQAWPSSPLRVEVVAYAQWAGAYTTDDPPLITMSSLNEEHKGSDGLEQLFHECSHLMMATVDSRLRSLAPTMDDDHLRNVSHTVLFYTVGEIMRRTVAGHVPYAIHYKVWQRGWTRNFELLQQYWQPYLDGKATMDDALGEISRAL